MKLRLKLMVAPGLASAMLLLTLAASLWVLIDFKNRTEAAHQQVLVTFARTAAVQTQLNVLHTQVYRTITIAASLDDKTLTARRKEQASGLDAISREFESTALASHDAGIQKDLSSLTAQIARYLKSADSALDLASVDANTGVAAMQTADADFKDINVTMARMIDQVKQNAVDVGQQTGASVRMAFAILLALGLVAAGAAIGFSWLTQRRIVANIDVAVQAAVQVAQGRLDVKPQSEARDEVGDLLRALGKMVGQLRESIHTVQIATESMGSASSEIATGNQDLSVRTEQTASNLRRTASSMEQLTGHVRQSTESARQADQLATSAAQVAERGGVVVASVVATMDDITASSRKIADIISVIDGIAFQTNILALNAAVEAARAGEQGRGFAVVAVEVRSLANRSAGAAREIKTLIGASVDKVQDGARLAADAGRTMQEIVGSVQRVSHIIGEITAASGEQSDSIEAINRSMGELDQMTQQNSALVEQSAAAAESLKEQAHRLAAVVGTFHLGGDVHAAATTPPRQPAPCTTRLDRARNLQLAHRA